MRFNPFSSRRFWFFGQKTGEKIVYHTDTRLPLTLVMDSPRRLIWKNSNQILLVPFFYFQYTRDSGGLAFICSCYFRIFFFFWRGKFFFFFTFLLSRGGEASFPLKRYLQPHFAWWPFCFRLEMQIIPVVLTTGTGGKKIGGSEYTKFLSSADEGEQDGGRSSGHLKVDIFFWIFVWIFVYLFFIFFDFFWFFWFFLNFF